MKQIKMTSPSGVTLYTSGKYVNDDIAISNGLPRYNGETEGGISVSNGIKRIEIESELGEWDNYVFQAFRLDIDYSKGIKFKIYDKHNPSYVLCEAMFIFYFYQPEGYDAGYRYYSYNYDTTNTINILEILDGIAFVNYSAVAMGISSSYPEETFWMSLDTQDQGDWVMELYYYEGNVLSPPVCAEM